MAEGRETQKILNFWAKNGLNRLKIAKNPLKSVKKALDRRGFLSCFKHFYFSQRGGQNFFQKAKVCVGILGSDPPHWRFGKSMYTLHITLYFCYKVKFSM